jgi:hypothetical protein
LKWCAKSLMATWRNQPLCFQPSLFHRHLGDPVDHRETGARIGLRDRIEHHALAMRAEADERGAGADRLPPGHAAPHHRAAPVDRRLAGMHLRAHRRVDAVGADQQRALGLGGCAVGVLDQRADAAVRVLAVAGDAAAEPHRGSSSALHELVVQQHVELAAVHRVLRPVVAGEQAARLRIDVVAVEADQRPFPGGQPDAVEICLGEAEVVKLAHRIGLQIDADPERPHLADRLKHDAGHADLMERQRGGKPADAAARDEDRSVRSHVRGHRISLSFAERAEQAGFRPQRPANTDG